MNKFASIFRPGLFQDQVVLVTGGGTGLGRCTAHELASLGATVIVAGRTLESLERTRDEIVQSGGICDLVQLNIRDEHSIESAIGELIDRHGAIHGLFNNAGGQFASPAADMSANAWRTVIDLNLNGTFLMMHTIYRLSMREHGGSIVNMLADIWTGYPGMAHSSAARAGIENLSRTLTMEWAAADVRINCVAPGMILSSGMLTYPSEMQERAAKMTECEPSARMGTESEVSAAVVFLLSPAATYIRGETLRVDGGSALQKDRLLPVGGHAGSRAFNGFHLASDFAGTPYQAMRDKQK